MFSWAEGNQGPDHEQTLKNLADQLLAGAGEM